MPRSGDSAAVKATSFLWYGKTLEDMAERHFMDHEILVLFEGEAAKKSHQELFLLPDAQYRIIEGAITEDVAAVFPAVLGELHIAAGWETILSVALWSRLGPSVQDVATLLKKSGKTDADLFSPEDLDLRDIFSLFCREERFDFLRKICNMAKANVESRCGRKTKVHCHLVSEESEKIVASSL
jgi:hypothetical protein